MFPDVTVTENTTTTTETASIGKSFLFDFDTGDFSLQDGNVVVAEGIEALKVWIVKTIKTEKYKFDIYDEYGATLQDLISSGYSKAFIESEIKREITAALLKNVEITGVSGFTFTRENRGLTVAFTVNSIYGTTEREVII